MAAPQCIACRNRAVFSARGRILVRRFEGGKPGVLSFFFFLFFIIILHRLKRSGAKVAIIELPQRVIIELFLQYLDANLVLGLGVFLNA